MTKACRSRDVFREKEVNVLSRISAWGPLATVTTA
jgi:hypothetical protein